MKNIILCGFMGCGKSSVGEILAELLNRKFIDMDSYISTKAGMDINGIFAGLGEQAFRDMEHTACAELAEEKGAVIATGGGTLTFERNACLLRQNGTIVFIDVPLEIIEQRLAQDNTRPMLKKHDLRELYEERRPLYKKAADFTVSGVGPPEVVAEEIINLLP